MLVTRMQRKQAGVGPPVHRASAGHVGGGGREGGCLFLLLQQFRRFFGGAGWVATATTAGIALLLVAAALTFGSLASYMTALWPYLSGERTP